MRRNLKPSGYQTGIPEERGIGPFYVGMDIARRGHLTVIWVLEEVGDVLWARELVEMRKASFAAQDEELDRVMRVYNPIRACLDQTGMGEKVVEDAKKRWGEYRIEGVLFSGPVKLDLANSFRRRFEDRQIRIPRDRALRDDLHSVKKITTAAGNVRFDAEKSEDSHADRFWAGALAVHARSDSIAPACAGTERKEQETVTGRKFGVLSRGGGLWNRFRRRVEEEQEPEQDQEEAA